MTRRICQPGEGSVVELVNGSVAIAGRPVLRGVNLQIEHGEFLALMGANGSGKSTLVRALTGLRPLARGSLRLFDTDFHAFKQWHRIGYVPQRTGATSGIPASVWEVAASGRLTHRGLFRRLSREDHAAIEEAIDIVGLTDQSDAGVGTLSGGQQQRVLIARALAGRPDVFFLDEPTAGVDLPNQQVLADTLGVLSARGATIVLVAHELGPMTELVDRAVVMREGRVAYAGPPLTDAQVHLPGFGREQSAGDQPHHSGHHHGDHHRPPERDHLPRMSAPLDQSTRFGR